MNEIPATEDAKDTEDAKEYINTGTSLFVAIPFNEGDLLANCVAYVSDKLLINPPAVIFGKSVNMRRSIGFFSNESVGYAYSGQVAVAQSLNEDLLSLLDLVNKKLNSDFNAILVNKYPDGNHYIGKHSDDERALSNKGVACLSYGACRKFRIRNKSTGKIVLDVPTNSNELWCMSGDFQKEFTHEVPVEKKVKEERISFTFRKHLNLSK